MKKLFLYLFVVFMFPDLTEQSLNQEYKSKNLLTLGKIYSHSHISEIQPALISSLLDCSRKCFGCAGSTGTTSALLEKLT